MDAQSACALKPRAVVFARVCFRPGRVCTSRVRGEIVRVFVERLWCPRRSSRSLDVYLSADVSDLGVPGRACSGTSRYPSGVQACGALERCLCGALLVRSERSLRKRRADHVLKMKLKDDNKTVALGTSKINYMDPRITVAFCKKYEIPIEKLFNKVSPYGCTPRVTRSLLVSPVTAEALRGQSAVWESLLDGRQCPNTTASPLL